MAQCNVQNGDSVSKSEDVIIESNRSEDVLEMDSSIHISGNNGFQVVQMGINAQARRIVNVQIMRHGGLSVFVGTSEDGCVTLVRGDGTTIICASADTSDESVVVLLNAVRDNMHKDDEENILNWIGHHDYSSDSVLYYNPKRGFERACTPSSVMVSVIKDSRSLCKRVVNESEDVNWSKLIECMHRLADKQIEQASQHDDQYHAETVIDHEVQGTEVSGSRYSKKFSTKASIDSEKGSKINVFNNDATEKQYASYNEKAVDHKVEDTEYKKGVPLKQDVLDGREPKVAKQDITALDIQIVMDGRSRVGQVSKVNLVVLIMYEMDKGINDQDNLYYLLDMHEYHLLNLLYCLKQRKFRAKLKSLDLPMWSRAADFCIKRRTNLETMDAKIHGNKKPAMGIIDVAVVDEVAQQLDDLKEYKMGTFNQTNGDDVPDSDVTFGFLVTRRDTDGMVVDVKIENLSNMKKSTQFYDRCYISWVHVPDFPTVVTCYPSVPVKVWMKKTTSDVWHETVVDFSSSAMKVLMHDLAASERGTINPVKKLQKIEQAGNEFKRSALIAQILKTVHKTVHDIENIQYMYLLQDFDLHELACFVHNHAPDMIAFAHRHKMWTAGAQILIIKEANETIESSSFLTEPTAVRNGNQKLIMSPRVPKSVLRDIQKLIQVVDVNTQIHLDDQDVDHDDIKVCVQWYKNDMSECEKANLYEDYGEEHVHRYEDDSCLNVWCRSVECEPDELPTADMITHQVIADFLNLPVPSEFKPFIRKGKVSDGNAYIKFYNEQCLNQIAKTFISSENKHTACDQQSRRRYYGDEKYLNADWLEDAVCAIEDVHDPEASRAMNKIGEILDHVSANLNEGSDTQHHITSPDCGLPRRK